MKKTLVIIAIACIALAMPAQAQVKFGLKGGVNLNSLSTEGNLEFLSLSNQTGFFVGPTVKFTVPLVGLSLDASALFDQRSAEIKGTNETVKSQTLQVPINLRYGVGLSSIANVFVFAGPQFGFNIGDKKMDFQTVQEWRLKESNISGNVGIGATIIGHLQVTANYNFQVSKAAELDYKVPDSYHTADKVTGKMKFNTWQLGLTYFF